MGLLNMKALNFSVLALVFTAPYASAQDSNNQLPRVMHVVADRIVADHPTPVATVVGAVTTCRPQSEGAVCAGPAYKDGGKAATSAGQILAAQLRVPYSLLWDDAVKSRMTAPIFDPKATEATKYHFCTAQKGETLPFILTIRPSAIRENVPGSEWHVLVYINQDPVRGECMGSGSGYEYVVVKDASSDTYRIAKITWFGSGSGHIWK